MRSTARSSRTTTPRSSPSRRATSSPARWCRIDKDEVLVDIGYKSEGVIPSGELSIRKSVDTSEEVEIGEEVDALVLTKEDQDGRLILSKKRARFERAWRRIEAAAESGEPVIGAVIEVVKGGLIIDLGVRGFLPASLVDIRRVPNLDEYLGQNIQCKVIELNRSRNNVVLSRRAVLEEERKEQRQAILERLQPGLIIEGQISNIVDFGAFVDLDGIDGLIHISELSWSHVNHPSEILNIGDTVQVKVLDIDRDRQRISLGLKQTQEDPWQRVVDTYNVGDELEGTVTKVVAFGAFVEILEGVEGLVHISELAQQHVENPREIVQPGDDVKVKILEIDSERRRLSLSIKRVEGQVLPRRPIADAGDLENVPELGLSEDVFAAQGEVAERRGPGGRDRGGGAGGRGRGGGAGGRGRGGSAGGRSRGGSAGGRGRGRRAGGRSRRGGPGGRSRGARGGAGGRGGRRAGGRGPAGARGRARARGPRAELSPPPFVGLTGGIGAGKSEALAALERLGAATLSADAVVHELYRNPEIHAAVVKRWGEEVAPGGVVDRRAVARRAFADDDQRAWLEGLLWPKVGERIAEWRAVVLHARAAADRPRRRGAAAVRGRRRVGLRRNDRRGRRRCRAGRARRRPRPPRGRRADRPPAHAEGKGATSDVRGAQLRFAGRVGAGAVLCPCEVDIVTAHAQARPRTRRRPSRSRAFRRRALLLAFVAVSAGVVMLILSPWADKAVQEIRLPLRHDDIIRQQAEQKNLDPSLIAGVIYVESRFRDQTSHAGAKGLMQIMPSTADYIARKSGGTEFVQGDLATPQINISYGSWYLRYLLDHYHGNTILALAAYNAGEGKVDEWWREAADRGERFRVADHIPFPETRNYVDKVLEARRSYRREYARELGL